MLPVERLVETMAIKALILAVVASLGTACASGPEVVHDYRSERIMRARMREAYEREATSYARKHPNAVPRQRTSCPEQYPSESAVRVRCLF